MSSGDYSPYQWAWVCIWKCPTKLGENLKKGSSQTKSAHGTLKGLVTLEAGCLILFRYPTHDFKSFLGRGAVVHFYKYQTCMTIIQVLGTSGLGPSIAWGKGAAAHKWGRPDTTDKAKIISQKNFIEPSISYLSFLSDHVATKHLTWQVKTGVETNPLNLNEVTAKGEDCIHTQGSETQLQRSHKIFLDKNKVKAIYWFGKRHLNYVSPVAPGQETLSSPDISRRQRWWSWSTGSNHYDQCDGEQ